MSDLPDESPNSGLYSIIHGDICAAWNGERVSLIELNVRIAETISERDRLAEERTDLLAIHIQQGAMIKGLGDAFAEVDANINLFFLDTFGEAVFTPGDKEKAIKAAAQIVKEAIAAVTSMKTGKE